MSAAEAIPSAAPKTIAEAMRERGIAWTKYYTECAENHLLRAKAEHLQLNLIRDFVRMFMKDEITAKAMTKLYSNHPIYCEIYSKFASGKKTVKGVHQKFNKRGDLISEQDYHFANGKPYKPWVDGDEPDYFMESARVGKWDAFTIEPTTGLWCVKPEVMKTMGASHRKGVLSHMLAFAQPLFADDTEKLTDITFNSATMSYTFKFAA
jgi:hypothetical protein